MVTVVEVKTSPAGPEPGVARWWLWKPQLLPGSSPSPEVPSQVGFWGAARWVPFLGLWAHHPVLSFSTRDSGSLALE